MNAVVCMEETHQADQLARVSEPPEPAKALATPKPETLNSQSSCRWACEICFRASSGSVFWTAAVYHIVIAIPGIEPSEC